jgi:hypothetical protein
MKPLNMITYRFRGGLGEDELRKLTTRFAEVGQPPDRGGIPGRLKVYG